MKPLDSNVRTLIIVDFFLHSLDSGMADLMKLQVVYGNIMDVYDRSHKSFGLKFVNVPQQKELARLVSCFFFSSTTFLHFLGTT